MYRYILPFNYMYDWCIIAGIITTCSWLDSFFWIGYKRELKQEDLYTTPEEAQSQYLLECFNK